MCNSRHFLYLGAPPPRYGPSLQLGDYFATLWPNSARREVEFASVLGWHSTWGDLALLSVDSVWTGEWWVQFNALAIFHSPRRIPRQRSRLRVIIIELIRMNVSEGPLGYYWSAPAQQGCIRCDGTRQSVAGWMAIRLYIYLRFVRTEAMLTFMVLKRLLGQPEEESMKTESPEQEPSRDSSKDLQQSI